MPVSKNKKWLKDRNKYVSGYCNDVHKQPQCEGTKPKSWNGNPMPTCPLWDKCPCECHQRIDEMFEATGLPRQVMSNPDYKPDLHSFVMPERMDNPLGTPAVALNGGMDPERVEDAYAPAPVAPVAPLAQRRTETGRAARGGLEAQVWDACNKLFKPGDDHVTPKLVAEWISVNYKIPTPSTGAVNAVWDRWTRFGFATQAKKPNRFTGFTGEGTWEELARLKSSSKRQEKMARTAPRPR